MKKLEDFLMPTQKELFSKLSGMYKGRAMTCKNSYILVRGEAPIMLVAHLDTVHKTPVKHICKTQNGGILMSPQGIGGDDRCGVYALTAVHERSAVKPWLFCSPAMRKLAVLERARSAPATRKESCRKSWLT